MHPGNDYVVRGTRGTTTDLSFQLLGGEYTDANVPASEAAFDDRELDIAPDGSFQLALPAEDPGPVGDPRGLQRLGRPARHTVDLRTDTEGTAPPPLTRQLIEKRYAAAGKQLINRVKTWLQFPQWFYLDLPVNTMVAPRLTPGGLATQYSSVGHYELEPDQALVITLPVSDAPYLGFQLGSLWYISLDYINHQTSLNATQAQADPDGKIRIVVADPNPGVTNWVETRGHRRGFLQFRWQRVSRNADRGRRPNRRSHRRRRSRGRTAVLRAQQDFGGRLACAYRAAAAPNRQQDAGVTMTGMLDDKVVVISGVGPGLGTTLAHRCAQEGADLVLVARTADRLDEVAQAD